MESWLVIIVGQRVRQIRKQKGFSQEDLAEKAGFHFTYISAVERAEKNLTLNSLSKIADALETPVYQLVMSTDDIRKLSKTDQEMITTLSTLIHKLKSKDLKKVHLFLTEIMDVDKN